MPESDHQLLGAWRGGDRQAGSKLFDRHFRALRRFFRNKVRDESEADELVQRSFMACVSGVERFREEASFRTWLFAVAHNVLREHLRERAKRPLDFGSESIAALEPGPSTNFARQREHRVLLEGLRALPLESQVMLELYYWEQLPARELGLVFDVPVGTVRGRIRKAKELLSVELARLAREGEVLETTEEQLDDWARRVREAWGV